MGELKKVYVTRQIPDQGIESLRREFSVEVSSYEGILPYDRLIEKVTGIDGLLCLLNDRIDQAVIDAANPRLRVISNYAVGYNNIDIPAATRRHILVTNTPGVLTETTADLAWALLMACARRLGEGERLVRSGKFLDWGPMSLLGQDIYGATLGIVGMGRIGRAMARRAKGFSLNVLYSAPHRLDRALEDELAAEHVSLQDLLRVVDFVSLHVPLNEKTHYLVGEQELKLMKRTGYLINTSRGPVVNEKALVRALEEGWIAGAGLDVFENEPMIEPGLLCSEKVVMTPHIGSASRVTRGKMAMMAVQNLQEALMGRMPPHPVNPEVLDHWKYAQDITSGIETVNDKRSEPEKWS